MNRIALIIPHYANVSDTYECLESLKKQSIYSQFKIYLTFISEEEFESDNFIKQNPHVVPVKLSSNLGFAGSCNVGLKKALEGNSDIFITLNNDIILDKYCIDSLVMHAASLSNGAIISPKIYFYTGQEYHKDRYQEKDLGKVIWYAGGKLDVKNVYASHRGVDEPDCGQFDIPEETDFATGCCMVITKKVIETVGFFDEKYFLYYEDVDYSMRCKDRDLGVLYYPKARLWHKNASASGKPGSALHEYYLTRNRLYFGNKYAPTRTKLALFRESVQMLASAGVKAKAVKDYYFGYMG